MDRKWILVLTVKGYLTMGVLLSTDSPLFLFFLWCSCA
jgi:hypothetical protein